MFPIELNQGSNYLIIRLCPTRPRWGDPERGERDGKKEEEKKKTKQPNKGERRKYELHSGKWLLKMHKAGNVLLIQVVRLSNSTGNTGFRTKSGLTPKFPLILRNCSSFQEHYWL